MKKIIIIIICMFLPFLSIAQSTEEQLFEQVTSYYNAKEYEKAYPLYLELANNGNVRAQRVMGHYYYYGDSPVKKNYAKAYEWYKKAAEQGDGVALNHIGWMYKKGYYLTQSKEKAFEYFIKASDAGDAYGSVNAAYMYWDSDDESFPPIDKTKSYAQCPNYYDGASSTVSSKDSKDSYETKKNRHEIVNEDENYFQAVIDDKGHLYLDVIPTSPEEDFFLKAARQDTAYGLYCLAYYYDWRTCDHNFMHFRLGYDEDKNKHSLFTIAANHGSAKAQAIVGSDYMIEHKYAEALSWLEKAKENGATTINRPNAYLSVDAAIVACKHLKATKEYKMMTDGDCQGPGIPVIDGKNNNVYLYVENAQELIGVFKLNFKGQIISKIPIKYNHYGENSIDEHIEWKDDELYFDGIKL